MNHTSQKGCRLIGANAEFRAKIIGGARNGQGKADRDFGACRDGGQFCQLAFAIDRIGNNAKRDGGGDFEKGRVGVPG